MQQQRYMNVRCLKPRGEEMQICCVMTGSNRKSGKLPDVV